MSDKTKIEWTEATWNPVTGCTKVSPGCDHCYAETFAERWRGIPGHAYEQGFDVTLRPERLDQPIRWKRPRRIFVNSMSDLFHDDVPDSFIAEVFAVMALAGHHTFQLLTKRHGRLRSLLSSAAFYPAVLSAAGRRDPRAVTSRETGESGMAWPLPNVWVGVSAEDAKWAAIRVHALLATPAAVRWVSAEPLLGPINFRHLQIRSNTFIDALAGDVRTGSGEIYAACPSALDWVVVGGESGPGARPMLENWADGIRWQCDAARVPFLFKQWGAWAPSPNGNLISVVDTEGHEWQARMFRGPKAATGRHLDGQLWDQYPAVTS